MDEILERRAKLKTIYVTSKVNSTTVRFDKVTVKDSNEFLDSNGDPQFFIVDKEVSGVSNPSYYPYRDFSWKELVKERSDLATAVKNIDEAIEFAENKNYELIPIAISLADLRTVLDELAKLTIAVEAYHTTNK